MSKITKVLVIMLSVMLVFSLTMVPVNAFGGGSAGKSPTELLNSANNKTGGSSAINAVGSIGGVAKNTIQLIGVAAAIIILAIYGLQWFTGGSQQKAQLKDKLWGYIIGAVLCFAGPTVFFALADMVSGLVG